MIERLAVDEHMGRIDLRRAVVEWLVLSGDEVRFEKGPCFASGTVTEVGEDLIETTHLAHANTLRDEDTTKMVSLARKLRA